MFPLSADTSKRSSIHSVNADKGLRGYQKPLWWLLNRANNLFPYAAVDDSLVMQDFKFADLKEHWDALDEKCSPSRKMSDLFWMQLPWEQILEELGEIHIVDVGCGSGNYGVLLKDWTNGKMTSYTGIDAVEHSGWPALGSKHINFSFRTADSRDFSGVLPDSTNFFISQSAAEHFEEDLTFFRQIRDFIVTDSKRAIQIHMIPSRACLRLYRFHGVRQYTPRTISKITDLFRDFSTAVLVGLGGQRSNRLHYEFITKPRKKHQGLDLRDTKTREYDESLYSAIKQDMERHQTNPAFYALVIHSNPKNALTLPVR